MQSIHIDWWRKIRRLVKLLQRRQSWCFPYFMMIYYEFDNESDYLKGRNFLSKKILRIVRFFTERPKLNSFFNFRKWRTVKTNLCEIFKIKKSQMIISTTSRKVGLLYVNCHKWSFLSSIQQKSIKISCMSWNLPKNHPGDDIPDSNRENLYPLKFRKLKPRKLIPAQISCFWIAVIHRYVSRLLLF